MLPIDKQLSGLKKEIVLWSRLLRSNPESLQDIDAPDMMDVELLDDGDESGISVGFALEALVAATARLHDITVTASRLWPHVSDEYYEIYNQYRLEESSLQLAEILKSDTTVPFSLLIAETSPWHQEQDNESVNRPADLLAVFDSFCSMRRCIAKASMLGNVTNILNLLILHSWRNGLLQEKERLDRSERRQFTEALRSYLASEYLFSWLAERPDEATTKQLRTLHEVADPGDSEMLENNIGILKQQLENLEVDPESMETIVRIFHRVSDAINEIGDYGEAIRSITAHGGQWGPGSMIDTDSPVNIIPSSGEEGTCQRVLIAFARGKSGRTGLKSVLRQVRRHLIVCGDSSCSRDEPTRIVILFTDIWDRSIFSESLSDFQAHQDSYPLRKVFIGGLVNGNQVTPQNIV